MKMIVFLIALTMALISIADEAKPKVYMTSDSSNITYYSVPMKDFEKFEIVYLEWKAYRVKFNYGWTLKEGEWVRVAFEKEETPRIITLPVHIPPIRNSHDTLIIENKTISGQPYTK